MLRAVESAADDSVVATLSRRGPWYWDHRQWLVTSLHWDVDWCWWSSYSTDSAPYRLHSGKRVLVWYCFWQCQLLLL